MYKNARDWLMSAKGLTEDQAITLLTVGCDFNVHQVGEAAPAVMHCIADAVRDDCGHSADSGIDSASLP